MIEEKLHRTYNKTLIELVIAEATNLKKFATKEEKKKLTLKSFNPQNKTDCIYGQMTGDCYSDRASQLIYQCAPQVYKRAKGDYGIEKAILNWKTELVSGDYRIYTFYSPIEKFIFPQENFDKAKLILKFIKGTAKTLELN